jgi:ATP-dependent Clp protease ATP-binding subunit ClpX
LPELIARFDRIIPFRALDEDALADILRRNLVKTYAREFELEGIELVVDDSVVKHLIRQAVKRETGARGLRSAFARLLENASFDLFSEKELKSVHILSEKDEIKIEKA